jgi:hypothetical protein
MSRFAVNWKLRERQETNRWVLATAGRSADAMNAPKADNRSEPRPDVLRALDKKPQHRARNGDDQRATAVLVWRATVRVFKSLCANVELDAAAKARTR